LVVSNGLSFRFVSFEKEERVLERRSSMNRKGKKISNKKSKEKAWGREGEDLPGYWKLVDLSSLIRIWAQGVRGEAAKRKGAECRPLNFGWFYFVPCIFLLLSNKKKTMFTSFSFILLKFTITRKLFYYKT
jgi:hypothetical protein